jgi:hypothetical protein
MDGKAAGIFSLGTLLSRVPGSLIRLMDFGAEDIFAAEPVKHIETERKRICQSRFMHFTTLSMIRFHEIRHDCAKRARC